MLTLYADLGGLQGPDRYREAYWRIQEELPFGYQEAGCGRGTCCGAKKGAGSICHGPQIRKGGMLPTGRW